MILFVYCLNKIVRERHKPEALNSVRKRNKLGPTDLDKVFLSRNGQFLAYNLYIITPYVKVYLNSQDFFQLPVIFKQIRESMKSMYSHTPDDAIFLLNKWDALILKHQKKDFFEETKKKLCQLWPEAKADYIIQFAAARVRLSFKIHT